MTVLSAAALAAFSGAASAVPLMFDNATSTATGSSFLGDVTMTQQIEFLDVATDYGITVDVRVTAAIKTQTVFAEPVGSNDAGYIADYNSTRQEPRDDLGFIYYGENLNTTENGITLTFDFFNGTGAMSGTFEDIVNISELNFAIYDVDGESADSTQSEYFRAYADDGLVSYQLGDTPQALVVTEEEAGTYRFDGPGVNFSEADPTGAAILNYEDVSSLTIDFGSVMSGGNTLNPVFSAFDGDLSLFDINDFLAPVPTQAPTAVPLPAGLPMLLAGLGGLALLRRRNR